MLASELGRALAQIRWAKPPWNTPEVRGALARALGKRSAAKRARRARKRAHDRAYYAARGDGRLSERQSESDFQLESAPSTAEK